MTADAGRRRESMYKPPVAYMPNAIWVIVFVFYVLVMLINQSKTEVDPWFAWGGWLWFFATVFFKIAPMKIAMDSKKCVGNRIGSTLFQSKPVGVIPAEDGYPDMVIFPGGSVGAWNFHDTAITTRSLVIIPKTFAHEYNGQIAFNAWLETYLDHDELPPHVVRYLKEDLIKPKYDSRMPVEFGVFPYLVHQPGDDEKKKFREMLFKKGLTEKQIENALPELETYAVMVTPFKLPADIKDDEDKRMRALNRKYALLQRDYDDLRTRHSDFMRLVQFSEHEPPQKRPLIPLIPPRAPPEEEQRQPYRDEYGRR